MDYNEGEYIDPSVDRSDTGIDDDLSNPLSIVENKDGSRIISPLVLQTISIVLNFRADIVCQHSIDRPCGYLIRPQIWFLKMSPSIHHHLKSIGLEPQKRYTRTEDITRILHSVKPIEPVLQNSKGLEKVKRLNGILRQPSTHKEVLEALDLIERTVESL